MDPEAPAKILYFLHNASLTGAPVSCRLLADSLPPETFAAEFLLREGGPLEAQLGAGGRAVHHLPYHHVLSLRYTTFVRRLCRRAGVRLVHLNNVHRVGTYVALAARWLGLPVIWHVREDPAVPRTRRVAGRIARLADRIVPVSDQIRRDLFPERPDTQVRRIYNGVDCARFRPGGDPRPFREELGLPRDRLLIGLIGSLKAKKGVLPFVQALTRLARAEPDRPSHIPWTAVILGAGHRDHPPAGAYRTRVEETMAAAGLNGRIHLLPPRADLGPVYAALDLLVLPSRWEGHSRALLEGMAAGCPVVASAVGGTPEMIRNGAEGLLVPPDDPEALAAALGTLTADPERRRALGAAARERVARDFPLARHVDQVLALYRELLAPASVGAAAGC